jgi:hypothetical protein
MWQDELPLRSEGFPRTRPLLFANASHRWKDSHASYSPGSCCRTRQEADRSPAVSATGRPGVEQRLNADLSEPVDAFIVIVGKRTLLGVGPSRCTVFWGPFGRKIRERASRSHQNSYFVDRSYRKVAINTPSKFTFGWKILSSSIRHPADRISAMMPLPS